MKDPTGFLRPPSASAVAPAIALAIVLSAAACSDPLEFPAWTVPAPEGTPLREYAGVPLGERGEHIELIEDLVIGERGDDGNYRLYDAAGPVVDSEGNFYVLDTGNYRVQVFDASGEYVRTLGRQGQGPGELTQPRAVVIAGDRIVVLDSVNRRYSAWALDGEYLGETASSDQYVPGGLQAFDDGTLLGRVIARREDDGSFNDLSTRSVLATYSAEFAKALDVQEFPPMKVPSINRVTPTSASFLRVAVPVASPSHTAARSGEIYTCLCEEYQVYAFDREATMRWALRATYDAQGGFMHTVGGEGEGPGEYRDIQGMKLTPDGNLAIWDVQIRRITVFRPDGTWVKDFPGDSGIHTSSLTFQVDHEGNFYLYTTIRSGGMRVMPARVSWRGVRRR